MGGGGYGLGGWPTRLQTGDTARAADVAGPVPCLSTVESMVALIDRVRRARRSERRDLRAGPEGESLISVPALVREGVRFGGTGGIGKKRRLNDPVAPTTPRPTVAGSQERGLSEVCARLSSPNTVAKLLDSSDSELKLAYATEQVQSL